MVSTEEIVEQSLRARILLVIGLAALLFLGVSLFRVQVINASEFRSSLERQSVRRVRLPATRGLIFDRNGVCLAENRPSYCLAIYVEELRRPGRWSNTVTRVEEVIDEVGTIMGLEPRVTRRDIRNHVFLRLPLPFIAWRDIDQRALARWAESPHTLPGVDIYVEPIRVYPEGRMAAHILGYVGRASPRNDPDVPYDYYLPEMEGRRGVEQVFNDVLTGQSGGRLLRVDASGYKNRELAELAPVQGRDITLTIDSRIQRYAERMLLGERGATVVLDVRNGEILALASSPTFDPNDFTPSVPQALWDRMRNDDAKPLFHRAVSGAYPPGSTFKPVVALAAVQNGGVEPGTTFDCTGVFMLGRIPFGCWQSRGHGALAMRKAIEQSCNCYFYQLGLRCTHRRIYHMADAMGFGRRTGVELPYESAGLLPGEAWKRRTRNEGWYPGDTCNLSIGQGALTTTPLRMAVMAAALATRGKVLKPRIELRPDEPAEIVNELRWASPAISTVHAGMVDVIHAPSGTGKRARIEGVRMAGKTGTAQYGPPAGRRKHGWMIAYAPAEQPRYAVAMVIEDAISGGISVAPRLRELMQRVFVLDGTLGARGETRTTTRVLQHGLTGERRDA